MVREVTPESEARAMRERAVRDAKCGVILDAAREVFADRGYHETRLEDIAAGAGFSKASLYNYFNDKEEIFLSLAVREYGRVVEAIESIIKEDLSFEQSLGRILREIFSHFGEHFAFVLATSNYQMIGLMHAEMGKHENLTESFREELQRVQKLFEQFIRAARKSGVVSSPLPDSALARYLGALIRGVLFEWKTSGRMGNIDTATSEVTSFVRSGMGVREGDRKQ